MHLRDLLHAAIAADPARYAQVLEGRSEEQFVNDRIEALLVLGEPVVQRIGDSWLRTTDRRTPKGGIVSLSLDVTWHVETEAQLRQTAVAAEAAARAKADFLATMSHEIRTPMNGVIGMANLLVKTRLDPEQREFAETIRSCGESLLVLINDVLDFSKMEAGKLELENASFPLHNLVEDVVLLFAEEAEKKKLPNRSPRSRRTCRSASTGIRPASGRYPAQSGVERRKIHASGLRRRAGARDRPRGQHAAAGVRHHRLRYRHDVRAGGEPRSGLLAGRRAR